MPANPEEIITGTIDDYLLALADGIVKAQSELNLISAQGAPGQPQIQYQLPKLDFELKMSFSLERETETKTGGSSSSGRRAIPFTRKIPILKAMPMNPETISEDFTTEGVSTIKGSFIALPVNGGKPPNVLGLALMEHSKTKAVVRVSLSNALGEPISHQTVAMGVDREYSEELNGERGLSGAKQSLKPSTDFQESEVVTGSDGTVLATLNIAPQEANNVSIVIEASIGNLFESLVIHKSA